MKKHCGLKNWRYVMPVKFWQMIIRVWFFLSYLITTVKRAHHRTLSERLWLRQAKAHYLRLARQARQQGQPGCCNEVFFLDTLPFFLRTTKLPVKGLGQREILVVTFCFFRPCSFSLVKVAAAHHCFKSKRYGYQGIPLSLICCKYIDCQKYNFSWWNSCALSASNYCPKYSR